MTTLLPTALAETTPAKFEPLFGSQWLALLVILAGIAVFMLVIAALGRWLAATHPEEPPPPTPEAPSIEIFAAIAAAVAVTFGNKARIASVQSVQTAVTVDAGHLQWGAEGRRQIYSSHKVR